MTKQEAREFLNNKELKLYWVYAGFRLRLLERYRGNKNKAQRELRKLERKAGQAELTLYGKTHWRV